MIVEKYASYGGVRSRILRVPGADPPYVLLHGFTDSADTWRELLEEFEAAGRAAVALDLPGFGCAEPLRDGEIMAQLDLFLDSVLEAYESVVLVGNSLGAALSVRAAARQHPAVRAVAALDEPFLSRHWLARYARRKREPWGLRVVKAGIPVPTAAIGWVRRRTLPRVLYGDPRLAKPEVVERWTSVGYDARQIATVARQARQIALETVAGYQNIDDLRCPLLVIHGGRDRIIPVDSSVRLHGLVPGSELHILPRSGHCPQLDAPAEVASLIRDFEHRRITA